MENSLMYHVTDNVRGSVLLADGSPHFDCPANGLTMEPSSIHIFNRYPTPAVRVWHPQAGDGPADHHVSNAKRSGRVQHVLRRNRQADTAAAANQQLAVYGYELGSDKARSPHPLPVALRLSLDFFCLASFAFTLNRIFLPSASMCSCLGESSKLFPSF